jgi:polysaccharide pyruvyl transferase WcaK-like protein
MIKSDCDLYITGSDQVWRYNNFSKFKGFDPVYWGKYPEVTAGKKCCYAASMGVLQQGIDDSFIKKNILNFDTISVRETALKIYLGQLTNNNIITVIDPVLLLNRNEWCSLFNNRKPKKKKYILFYQLNKSSNAYALVKYIAKKNNLKVIELKGGVSPFYNPLKAKQTAGPIQFVKLFANAEYIVSTSFHGVVFSIVFEKQFFALGFGNNSDRVRNLLEQLNIEDRYINEQNDMKSVVDNSDIIDFVEVQKKLKLLRTVSENYISLMLNNDGG